MGQASNNPFDQDFCKTFKLLPLVTDESSCKLHLSELSDLSVVDFVRFRSGTRLEIVKLPNEELTELIEAHFSSGGNGKRSRAEENPTVDHDTEKVTGLLDQIVISAIADGASDLHFEISETALVCRTRIDGILHIRKRFSADLAKAMLSRIKIISGLDIAERRRPQDGRIRFDYQGRIVDIRVSVIPTDFGEKAVLRILDKETLRLDLAQLGFTDSQRLIFEERISQPHGIILVTGPTGSGKTTTLYAALNRLKSDQVNISTIEDPIEYNLEGINQTAVKPTIGVTFASMLRSFLRQDPNIIMVGEIRDTETLEIAIQASLTGHLVLSTLHTNDSIATVARLLDLGAEPSMLASTLRLIVAQRLVRKNCKVCFDSDLSDSTRAAATKLNCDLSNLAGQGVGCDECHQTGYAGRTSLYELLPIGPSIREAIDRGETEATLRSLAKQSGFISMREQGIDLINQGVTTATEVLREVSS